MMQYFDLSDDQFETVVVAIGQRLFGPGLMGFAPGKDGGRDAKFKGTAQCYPSAAAPWTGCTIIQAKLKWSQFFGQLGGFAKVYRFV